MAAFSYRARTFDAPRSPPGGTPSLSDDERAALIALVPEPPVAPAQSAPRAQPEIEISSSDDSDLEFVGAAAAAAGKLPPAQPVPQRQMFHERFAASFAPKLPAAGSLLPGDPIHSETEAQMTDAQQRQTPVGRRSTSFPAALETPPSALKQRFAPSLRHATPVSAPQAKPPQLPPAAQKRIENRHNRPRPPAPPQQQQSVARMLDFDALEKAINAPFRRVDLSSLRRAAEGAPGAVKPRPQMAMPRSSESAAAARARSVITKEASRAMETMKNAMCAVQRVLDGAQGLPALPEPSATAFSHSPSSLVSVRPCARCKGTMSSVALIPCGHVVLCEACSFPAEQYSCPMCNRVASSFLPLR
jgi:hypothetical protein